MSQSIFTSINPATTSGNQLATLLNNFKDAMVSGCSGTSRPSALQAGGVWVDVTNDPTSWTLKLYDGTTDISLFVIDLTLGVASVTTNNSLLTIIKSSDDAVGAILKFFKDRPTGNQTLAGDTLGEIDFYGNRDTDVETIQARIKSVSTNNVTATAQGAYLLFEGTTLGAASIAEWMRLVDGKLGLGTTAPDETFHLVGTGAKIEKNSDDAVGSKIVRKKKRITGVGQVQSADVISSDSFNSTDDTGLDIQVAEIEVKALELHTSAAQGTGLKIKTKKTGESALTTRIDITSTTVNIPDLSVGTLTNTEIGYLDGVTSSIQTQLNTEASARSTADALLIPLTQKGAALGVAELDAGGKVPAAQLPSYVDDILEYADFATLPVSGVAGIIYVTLDTSKLYRWSGSAYVEVSSSLTDTLLSSTAFTLSSARHFEAQAATDSSTTGADAVATAFTAGAVRFTNASLTSLATIPAGSNGQVLYAFNRVGTDVTVKDSSDALGTAANRILTGTGTSITWSNNAALILMYDSTTARWQIMGGTGSGSSSGGINYITNYNAEAGTTGWATYADAAATSPVDGTGGAPTTTFTRTTSSPLRGVGSFLITKDAANRQGEGASYAFTIDAADKGKVLQGSFDYQVASGTFADNDISVWILDVTNSRLIQPAPYLIKNSGIIEKYGFEFQSSGDSVSYRLIIHVSSTSALAYTVKLDNFSVGPAAKLYGSAITDWVAYTPTYTGFGTVTVSEAQVRRVGDTEEYRIKFTAGTPTATEARISLRTGSTSADTAKIPSIQAAGSWFKKGTSSTHGGSVLIEPSVTYFTFSDAGVFGSSSSAAGSKANGDATVAATDGMILYARVPIQGASSSQVLSSDASTRIVAARYFIASSVSGSNTQPINFATKSLDTHAAVTVGAAWKFTAPVSGTYRINTTLRAVTSGQNVDVYKNGSQYSILGHATNSTNGSQITTVDLLATEYIDVRFTGSDTTSSSTLQSISIDRISGPSQIMASETVSALYTGAPPTGTLNGSAFNPITFGTKVKDSHNAYSAGVYTVPVSGTYAISARTRQNATYSTNNEVRTAIFVNGANAYQEFSNAGAAVATRSSSVTVQSAPLLAGALITVQCFNEGSGPSFASDATTNFFSITRTGNY